MSQVELNQALAEVHIQAQPLALGLPVDSVSAGHSFEDRHLVSIRVEDGGLKGRKGRAKRRDPLQLREVVHRRRKVRLEEDSGPGKVRRAGITMFLISISTGTEGRKNSRSAGGCLGEKRGRKMNDMVARVC